jgi:hypothetical protein
MSRTLSDATEYNNELHIAAKETGLEVNTDKTKLSIQSRRTDKQIHSITLMREIKGAVKDFVCPG